MKNPKPNTTAHEPPSSPTTSPPNDPSDPLLLRQTLDAFRSEFRDHASFCRRALSSHISQAPDPSSASVVAAGAAEEAANLSLSPTFYELFRVLQGEVRAVEDRLNGMEARFDEFEERLGALERAEGGRAGVEEVAQGGDSGVSSSVAEEPREGTSGDAPMSGDSATSKGA